MSKKSITFFILFLSFSMGNLCLSQEVDYTLGEIQVQANLQSYYQEDTRREVLDSILSSKYSFLNLGEVLKEHGGIMVSSYGSRGSLSGVKIRGTGDNHTRFHWNGIPLNSLTTGTMDASLIPASFMQNVVVTKGASGVLAGNASFGGAIYLENSPDWNQRINVSLNSELGSFGYKAIMPTLLLSSENIQYRVSFQKISADNDFKFEDTFKNGSPIEKQQNDSLEQTGLIQNLFVRLNNNFQLDLGLWTQSKSKDIPPVMGSYNSFIANQKDRSLKAYVKMNKLFARSRIQLQFSYLNDSLHYTQFEAGSSGAVILDSRIQTQNFFSKAEWRWFINRFFTIDLGAHAERPSALVNSYREEKKESRFSLISAAKFRNKGWVANVGIRKEFNPYNPPKPQFSAGLSWKSDSGHNLFRGNISNKFRIPSFNERYWQPGGNPDLLPESGWGGEIAWAYEKSYGQKFKQRIEPLVFYQKIHDWIQWIPSAGYWNPVNQDVMISKGFEVNGLSGYQNGDFEANMVYKYSFTDARQADGDNSDSFSSVVYVPKHQGIVGMNFIIKSFSWGSNYQYLGKRHTTKDLNPVFMLKDIHLVNIYGSYKFQSGKYLFEIFARINNVGNYQYQIVRSYATPGISGTVGIKINFKTINKL